MYQDVGKAVFDPLLIVLKQTYIHASMFSFHSNQISSFSFN